MIVQPASLGPRSRPRRVLRIVALVLPVGLLAGVIALGALGPAPTPPPPAPSPRSSSEPAVAVANPTIGPAPRPEGNAPLAVFPRAVAGLDVHGVHWTLEARSRGIARAGVLAIAGYLALDEQPPECVGGGLGVVVPYCDRTGILAEGPWSGRSAAESDLPPFHLHPQVPYGVRVPYLATAGTGLDGALPVILLARFDDARAEPCIPEGRHCGQELVVERIAWVDGESFPRTVTVDPAVSGGPPGVEVERRGAEATAALAPGAYPLLAVLLRPARLADVDPESSTSLPAGVRTADDAVWYVRGLHLAGDPSRIDWLVLAADAQRVIASGSIALRTAFAPGAP